MSSDNDDFTESSSGLRRTLKRRSITMSFEAREFLAGHDFDPALLPIARNILTDNLGLDAGSGAVLVVELGWEQYGAPILRAAGKVGVDLTVFMVGPDQTSNAAFVDRLTDRIVEAEASIFVGSHDGLPPSFRRRLIATAKGHRRHAHLAGITKSIALQSLRGDHAEAHRFGEALEATLEGAKELEIGSALGTKLRVTLGPRGWHHSSNLIPPGNWSYLPDGRVFTTPMAVDGVLVPDGGVFLPDGTEHPRSPRLRLHFSEGRLEVFEGLDASDPLTALLAENHACNRVGRVAFGTNIGLLVPVGALLQDRTAPGIHLSLGTPAGEVTHGSASCAIEVPLFVRRADVAVDGTPIMVRGRYARRLKSAQTA